MSLKPKKESARKRVLRTVVEFSSNMTNRGRNVILPIKLNNIIGENDTII